MADIFNIFFFSFIIWLILTAILYSFLKDRIYSKVLQISVFSALILTLLIIIPLIYLGQFNDVAGIFYYVIGLSIIGCIIWIISFFSMMEKKNNWKISSLVASIITICALIIIYLIADILVKFILYLIVLFVIFFVMFFIFLILGDLIFGDIRIKPKNEKFLYGFTFVVSVILTILVLNSYLILPFFSPNLPLISSIILGLVVALVLNVLSLWVTSGEFRSTTHAWVDYYSHSYRGPATRKEVYIHNHGGQAWETSRNISETVVRYILYISSALIIMHFFENFNIIEVIAGYGIIELIRLYFIFR